MKRLAVVWLILLVACGKRGDPRPPVPVIPQATTDLVVAQRANRIVLSWSYPALTTAGRSLPEFRRIVVYRYSEELPPSATTAQPIPAEPAVADAVSQFARVPTLTPVQFARVATRINSIEGADLTSATVGSRLVYNDQPALTSVSGRPIRLTYAVVTEGYGARAELSNLVTVIPLPISPAPTALAATADAAGISLRWEEPKPMAGTQPVIIGYNVYRGSGNDLAREFTDPINATPVTGTLYKDAPPYGEHQYRVTAVASSGPPRLESEPSNPATVTFRDLVAPPPPAGVSALVETRAIRIVWEAVDAPDVAGYKLYRAEATLRQNQLVEVGKFPIWPAPVNQTNFRDAEPQIGISYRYEVTSVDKSGNESAPVSTGWVLVPRTP